tara:strand:+ start:9215 stop:9496 length:282 start_codon:yes stop_codon:yes gene_type:complete
MTIREICEYYGQQYDNVKHMHNYLSVLRERYQTEKKELGVLVVRHMAPKDKLDHVRDLLKELIDIGEDYGSFQSAQITHKNLKKAYKLLEGLS